MGRMGLLAAVCIGGLIASSAARAQEPVKPGPEHKFLKKLEGTWDASSDFQGNKSKGVMTYKMGLGGLWLLSNYKGEFAGQPFEGQGQDTYDPAKQKYIGIWTDSMSPQVMISEGTYDKQSKKMTMTSEITGQDGKPVKVTTVTEWKDDDNIVFSMAFSTPDGKDAPMMTITYKRKK